MLATIRHRVRRLLVRRGLKPSDDATGLPFAPARAIEQQHERIYALANPHHSAPVAPGAPAPGRRPVRKRLSIKPSPHGASRPSRPVTSETAR